MEKRWLTLLTFALGIAAGCSQPADPNRPVTYPVTGTITYQDRPVEGATVYFHPVDNSGVGAVGRSEAGGQYTLTTFRGGDGAVAGKYIVTVVRYDQPSRPSESAEEREDYETIADDLQPSPPPKNTLPEKYAVASLSDLDANVSEDGENRVDLQLR